MRKKPPKSPNPNYKQAKKTDWETWKLWAKEKLITLLYLDESGCCLESPLSFGYSQVGQQKSITQNQNRGRRINIMGVWETAKNLEYGLKVGTYKAKNYLQFMDTQADKAAKRLSDTGKLTVIIQDNASIHRANIVKERVQSWAKQGLMLFFLPPYSPEMNRIEDQWLHLKRQELAARVFDDEYDLTLAIIQGLENRGQQNNFAVERLMFN